MWTPRLPIPGTPGIPQLEDGVNHGPGTPVHSAWFPSTGASSHADQPLLQAEDLNPKQGVHSELGVLPTRGCGEAEGLSVTLALET